jgi:hypothetical protein
MRGNDNKKEEKQEKLVVPFISARGIDETSIDA